MKSLLELHSPRVSPEQEENSRKTIIERAIGTALKGNASLYDQASLMQAGRTKVARAYKAAFKCVPRPVKFPYKGKITAEQEVEIASQAAVLAEEFCDAYRKALSSA